jgi:hypothetical protein
MCELLNSHFQVGNGEILISEGTVSQRFVIEVHKNVCGVQSCLFALRPYHDT